MDDELTPGDPRLVPGGADDVLARSHAEQELSEAEQSSADLDQTASDTDQFLSIRDRRFATHDQLLSDADRRMSDRDQELSDLLATELGDRITPGLALELGEQRAQRAQTAQARAETSSQRSVASVDRASLADRRDQAAQTRDIASLGRDLAAEARDRLATLLSRVGLPAENRRAAAERSRAAADRERAAADRVLARLERNRESAAFTEDRPIHPQGTYRGEMGTLALRAELDRAALSGEGLIVAVVDVRGQKIDPGGLAMVVAAIREGLRPWDPIVHHGPRCFVCAASGTNLDEALRWFDGVAYSIKGEGRGIEIRVSVTASRPHDSLEFLIARGVEALPD